MKYWIVFLPSNFKDTCEAGISINYINWLQVVLNKHDGFHFQKSHWTKPLNKIWFWTILDNFEQKDYFHDKTLWHRRWSFGLLCPCIHLSSFHLLGLVALVCCINCSFRYLWNMPMFSASKPFLGRGPNLYCFLKSSVTLPQINFNCCLLVIIVSTMVYNISRQPFIKYLNGIFTASENYNNKTSFCKSSKLQWELKFSMQKY